MSEFITFLFGCIIGGVIVGLIVYGDVNGGWRKDCDAMGIHRSTDANPKVYTCAPRP